MMNAADHVAIQARVKRADLASAVGAGILGAGLGVLAAQYLGVGPYVVPLLLLGVVMHAWGMHERHRLDAAAPRVWWAEWLYWLCWAALLLILGLAVFRR